MVLRVAVRLFTIPADIAEEHCYLRGSDPSGLSDVLTVVPVREVTEEVGAFTFEQLRWKLESQQDGIMTKRTLAYREILTYCGSVRNYHRWNEKVRQFSYRLGYYPKASNYEGLPQLIDLRSEQTSDVGSFLGEKEAELCVVAVPLAHVGPVCEQVCKGCSQCTEGGTGDDQQTSYYFEGSVYSVNVSEIEHAYPITAPAYAETEEEYREVDESFV